MQFKWDEEKRLANVAKHALDFRDAAKIWLKDVIDPAGERIVDGEYRPTALGVVGDDDIIIAVVYTARDDVIRLISARRARRNERKVYQDRYERGI